jgi:LysR family glycine cleavage system transcriptional activator
LHVPFWTGTIGTGENVDPKSARIEAIVFRNLPLATLRTFDAAARHQSLAKASQELNLTDSAVSHQRRLEEALGVGLFEKAGRGVVLTDAGRVFARSVAAALHDIARTAHSLADAAKVGGRLTIACPPMFASKWLAKPLSATTIRLSNVKSSSRTMAVS